MIPSVFSGATQVYDAIGAEISNQTATAHKPQISTNARRMLENGNIFIKNTFLLLFLVILKNTYL